MSFLHKEERFLGCCYCDNLKQVVDTCRAKISVTSPIVINVPTRELLAAETKSSFVSWSGISNNKNNVCKHNFHQNEMRKHWNLKVFGNESGFLVVSKKLISFSLVNNYNIYLIQYLLFFPVFPHHVSGVSSVRC